jgi:ribosomal protein L22
MPNTEKPTTKAEQKKSGLIETSRKQKTNEIPIKQQKSEDKKIPEPKDEPKVSEGEKKEEKKKPIQKKPVVKKTEAVVNAVNLPVSQKYAVAICKFIKNKKIEKAISDLEQVLVFKKAVPMKGEIPHRKGKRIMSGRYPKNATGHFIKLLKNLSANANVNELNSPIIAEAVANFASRPFGRFGRWRRKRTHIRIIAKEKKKLNENEEKENKWKKEM